MEFNSLDAQREVCEAYVASQKAEGWVQLQLTKLLKTTSVLWDEQKYTIGI
jgi:hypothetical protein